MNERAEIDKWLRLGYETLGPAGVRAMAKAMGLGMGASRATTGDSWMDLTSTGGGATLAVDEDESQAPQTPAACPKAPPRGAPGWRPYVGVPEAFHCGFEGYLEDRDPSPDWPIAECFYDKRGQLVDGEHRYPRCKGTPNSYGAFDPRHWLWTDPGGIWAEGWGGALESQRYFEDQKRRLEGNLGRPYWRKYYRDKLNR